jgi:hypothetical protein
MGGVGEKVIRKLAASLTGAVCMLHAGTGKNALFACDLYDLSLLQKCANSVREFLVI